MFTEERAVIFIGCKAPQKNDEILRYCDIEGIKKVLILSPKKFIFNCGFPNCEFIEYSQIVEYKYFYRLLQEIDHQTLVIVNECLRTQNRYDLTYNCIRHFLNQAAHQIIFQYLPIIESMEDFMILFDFDTKSRWRREKFNRDQLKNCKITTMEKNISISKMVIPITKERESAYNKEKEMLVENIGLKDPHTIPRNLYLFTGKEKSLSIDKNAPYIGRNNRFRLPNLQTYKELLFPHTSYTIFEFCHNFIDFIDFLYLSGQIEFKVLCADVKVDSWYFNRYFEWLEKLQNAYANIQ